MYTPQFRTYADLLREIRLEAGLTQAELAEKLATDQTRVSCYERGQRRMDLMELEIYCTTLGVDLEDFVHRYRENVRNRLEEPR